MRKPLILAGAVALGGAAFFLPAVVAAQQVPGVTAAIEIACTTGVGGAPTHSYTVTVTNNQDGSIGLNGDATLTVNAGAPTNLANPDDSTLTSGQTATYPTAVPVTPDGDVAVTAVFHVTWDEDNPVNVTATAEPCGTTETTAPPEETTTSTSTPAVQAQVDFTG